MDAFTETYTLAHTARCKLKLAADRPDRDLRFILGHAFTLDKLRLRLAEIEESSGSEEDEVYDEDDTRPTCTGAGLGHPHTHSTDSPTPADAPAPAQQRRVSFSNNSRPAVAPQRQRSPPPSAIDGYGSDSDSDSSDDGIYDDYEIEAGGGLGLERFGSAAAEPPRLVADDGDDDEYDVKEPRSPTEEELRAICSGVADDELMKQYQNVADCPCHGHTGPQIEKVWQLPQKDGHVGPRVAIIQVAA